MKLSNVFGANKHKIQSAKNTNRKPVNISGWLVWMAAGLFYCYEVVLRAGPGVMTQGIMDTFTIDATHLGLLTSFYYYAYVPLQIPSGMLLDKIGPRVVITFSSLLCTIGTWLFATTTDIHVAQFARFILGAGSACAFISCLKIASEWFSLTKFAFIAGLSNMLGTLGGTFAAVPLSILVSHAAWQQATMWLAYAGVLITVLCWFLIRDKPKNVKTIKHSEPSVSLRKSLAILVLDEQIILAGIIGGLMYVPISSFAELWAVPFLMGSLNINSQLASIGSTMVFIGMAFGGPLIVKFAFKQHSYIKLMRKSAIASALCFLIGSYAKEIGYFPTIATLFIGGLWLGGQVLCFSVVKERVPNQISGTAMGFVNALVMLSGIVFLPLMGWILDSNWSGSLDSFGARIYSAEDYQCAIIAVPACLIISWVLLNFCKETPSKEED